MSAAARPGGRLRTALDRLYFGAGALAALTILVMFLLMMVQAIGRELGFQFRGAVELTAWSNAATAFLGLAYAFRHGDIIRVGLTLERLKGKARQVAEVICLSVAMVAAAYAVWAAASYVFQSWRMNEVTDGLLVIPIWIPQMSMVCGLVVFLIAVVDELICVASGHIPSYRAAVEERNRRGEIGEEN